MFEVDGDLYPSSARPFLFRPGPPLTLLDRGGKIGRSVDVCPLYRPWSGVGFWDLVSPPPSQPRTFRDE